MDSSMTQPAKLLLLANILARGGVITQNGKAFLKASVPSSHASRTRDPTRLHAQAIRPKRWRSIPNLTIERFSLSLAWCAAAPFPEWPGGESSYIHVN